MTIGNHDHAVTCTPRRQFRYSLRALFMAVVVVSVGASLVSQYQTVRGRRELITSLTARQGSSQTVDQWNENCPTAYEVSGSVSLVRKWLGDQPMASIVLPYGSTVEELEQVRTLFPEAPRIAIAKYPVVQGMM